MALPLSFLPEWSCAGRRLWFCTAHQTVACRPRLSRLALVLPHESRESSEDSELLVRVASDLRHRFALRIEIAFTGCSFDFLFSPGLYKQGRRGVRGPTCSATC